MSQREWVAGRFPPVGTICKYEYCRGGIFEGVCQIRGYHEFEAWCKTIKGENHFGGPNFVVALDCKFSPLTTAEESVSQ